MAKILARRLYSAKQSGRQRSMHLRDEIETRPDYVLICEIGH